MSELNCEIMNEVGRMLVGYSAVDLANKMEMLCQVAQYLLEKRYENLWVSLCSAPDDAVFNVVSGDWDGATLERDTLADADRTGADSVVVANDAWAVPTALTTHSGEDLSSDPARNEAIMVVARDGVQHLGGYKPFVRTGNKVVFGDLIIEPICDSWLNWPSQP